MADRIYEELREGRSILSNTRGASMRPLLREGKTQVLITPITRELRIGDLPLVRLSPGHYRLHRLIAVRDGIYCTLGDNSITPEQVDPATVLGLAARIYRGNRVISLEGPGYQWYTRFWLHTRSIRIPLLLLKNRLFGLAGKIRRRLSRHDPTQ